MRFDEYLAAANLSAVAVDRFDGYAVNVAVPMDWDPVDTGPGAPLWVWRADPSRAVFGANLVLTQSRVAAVIDPAEVFDMLCTWSVDSFPTTHEFSREVALAAEGPGILGRFGMLIHCDIGVVSSESLTRIIRTEDSTLITQLTLTALADSPVERERILLSVRPDTAADPDYSLGFHGAAPLTGAEGQ